MNSPKDIGPDSMDKHKDWHVDKCSNICFIFNDIRMWKDWITPMTMFPMWQRQISPLSTVPDPPVPAPESARIRKPRKAKIPTWPLRFSHFLWLPFCALTQSLLFKTPISLSVSIVLLFSFFLSLRDWPQLEISSRQTTLINCLHHYRFVCALLLFLLRYHHSP